MIYVSKLQRDDNSILSCVPSYQNINSLICYSTLPIKQQCGFSRAGTGKDIVIER